MSLETLDKKNKQILQNAGIAASVGTLTVEGLGHSYFNNKTTLSKALTRSGLAGLGTIGALQGIRYALRNSAKSTYSKLQKQKDEAIMTKKVASNNYYDYTGLQDFVKTAAETMGDEAYLVPTKLAYDAFTLYNSLPKENKASTTLGLYDQVKPGMDKIAMKLVAANVLHEKQASPVLGAKLLSRAGTALNAGFIGNEIAEGTKRRNSQDLNILTQGSKQR